MQERLKEFIYSGAAIVGQIKTEEQTKDIETELRRMIVEQEVFTVKVSGMREDAVTANVLGQYMGLIPKAQVSSRMYVRNNMQDLIGQFVPVVVKSFDPETKIATLSRTRAVKQLRDEFLNEVLPKLEEINADGINYKKFTKYQEDKDPYFNQYPVVKAKVISYLPEKKRVIVNIAGLDVLGSMDITKFDYKFIYNPEQYISEFMAPNTVIDVALLAYYDNSQEKTPSNFVVSRRHTMPNPWAGIEQRIKKDDIIVVKALQKQDGHFFAQYDNFPLDVKCYYPAAPDHEMQDDEKYGRRLIELGKEYMVKIEIINPTTQVLTASFHKSL